MKTRPEIALSLGLLLLNSWQDIRKREIFLFPTLLFLCVGIFLSACEIIHGTNIPTSFLYGGAVAAVSILTKEGVGMGDALVLTALSLFLKKEEFLTVVSIGMFLCMGAGIVLLIRKKDGRIRIPFIPFLTMGALLLFFMERMRLF